MPRLTTEHYGTGDQSWLGSMHGIHNARTVTLDPAKFTEADHYPDGYIPSGWPLTLDENGVAGPYDPAGEGSLDGFLLTDQVVKEGGSSIAVPLLDHGRVNTTRVPAPGFTAPDAARNKTTFVFV